jgi:uncharacterized protein (TIGR02246 family)
MAVMVLMAANPEAEVKALLMKQADAWNKGDLDSFCAVYADDASFVSPSGLTQGRAQVLARYKKRYPDKKAMGVLSFELVETRVAAGAVSLVARWKLSYPGEKAPDGGAKEASGLTLLVLHPKGASWQIVEDASM